jgi:ABC-type multidrug transport system ATPase subunit
MLFDQNCIDDSLWQLFDRVTVLYEGRQIYFGKATEAKTYFEEIGFECKCPVLVAVVNRQV